MIENERIRDYRILRKLGEGGMGTVYLAHDEELGREVALKVLAPELTRSSDFVERFRTEARVQASLMHSNIVTLYTFFQEQSQYYMVMEYAPGITLKDLIHRTGPIPEGRALSIFRQIVEAVGFAHNKGIVHRDLKPANIIVDENDSVKVMDFGIAKLLGDKGMTKTGTKMGTLYYMSPEQIKSAKDIDERADIYSLGMTLYEMLAGQIPFSENEQSSDFAIMNSIVHTQIPDPRSFYPAIPEWLVEVVMKATAKEKEKRIHGAEEFLRSITAPADSPMTPVKAIANPQPPVTDRSLTTQSSQLDPSPTSSASQRKNTNKSSKRSWIIPLIGFIIIVIALFPIIRAVMGTSEKAIDWIYVEGGPTGTFSISATEVTFDQYDAFCDAMGYEKPEDRFGRGKQPVVNVNVADAIAYCQWLSKETGRTVRLPEEEEWIYAAQGGNRSDKYEYSGSNNVDEVAWYNENSNETHEVGTKKPNELGIYDMSGNVWEWCGTKGSFRGGSWSGIGHYCRISYRSGGDPGTRDDLSGFRVLQK